MNKILLQCDNLCKRYQEGSVQTDVFFFFFLWLCDF